MWSAVGHTLFYATAAGLLATAGATVIAVSSHRARSWMASAPSTLALVPLAVPGVVVAFALSYATEHYLASRWYESTPLLIFAYTVMFLPLALIGIRSSINQVPRSLTEAAATLGADRTRQFFRVTLPLITPGVGVAFALVFLAVITELTATLMLIPTGASTLATQFWAYQSSVAYGQAAPYAAAMILLAGVPLALLTGLGQRTRRQRR
jgi:iron(III) transport system permease protein